MSDNKLRTDEGAAIMARIDRNKKSLSSTVKAIYDSATDSSALDGITTAGVVWGLLLGVPAGLVLQMILGWVLSPLSVRGPWLDHLASFSPVPAVVIASAVVLVPRLREWGAGFLLGLALGLVTEGLLLWWWLSNTF